ncbi:hypothetical protein SD51_11340 [Alicyclobacillus tengchongensis]|nr:hypothetical protein SD51_11340 [Alicyclobacillus tengchongensis]
MHELGVRVREKPLSLQLVMASLLLLSGVMAIIGGVQAVFMRQFLYQQTARSLHQDIMSTPGQVWMWLATQAASSTAGPAIHMQPMPFLEPGGTIAYVDMTGNVHPILASARVPVLPRQDYEAMLTFGVGLASYRLVATNVGQELVVTSIIGRPDNPTGLVQISVPTATLNTMVWRQLRLYGVIAFAALAVGSILYIPLVRRTLVPLRRVVDHAHRFNIGNLEERVPLAKGMQAEVKSLATSFNAMLDRIATAFQAEREAKEQMRQFVADASHELRTPLTAIGGYIEVLLRGGEFTTTELQDALRQMHGETRRLSSLVQQLLELAQVDQTEGDAYRQLPFGDVDIARLVVDMKPILEMIVQGRDLRLEVPVSAVMVRGNAAALRQVIMNLVQNAAQHTSPANGRIALVVKNVPGKAQLCVADNGVGVAKEHQVRLFERFYRVDSARSRANGGAGLGLAICKSLVEVHHGEIWCESEPGQGATFVVELPLKPAVSEDGRG